MADACPGHNHDLPEAGHINHDIASAGNLLLCAMRTLNTVADAHPEKADDLRRFSDLIEIQIEQVHAIAYEWVQFIKQGDDDETQGKTRDHAD